MEAGKGKDKISSCLMPIYIYIRLTLGRKIFFFVLSKRCWNFLQQQHIVLSMIFLIYKCCLRRYLGHVWDTDIDEEVPHPSLNPLVG